MKTSPYVIDDAGRQCAGCRQYKPWSEYHLSSGSPHGHESRCKACSSERKYWSKKATQPSLLPDIRERRFCMGCRRWLSIDEFVEYKKGQRRRDCKACETAQDDGGPHYRLTFGPNYRAGGLATGNLSCTPSWGTLGAGLDIDVTATWPMRQPVSIRRE